MLNQPEPACLLIADISGYTSYLAGVELDHAQDILADLIGHGRRLRSGRPSGWRSSRATPPSPTRSPRPSTARRCMDTIERTLLRLPPAAARHRPGVGLRLQRLHPDARPRPQVRRPSRDDRPPADGRPRGAGRQSDVIVVHRLLKNDVDETTGAAAPTRSTRRTASRRWASTIRPPLGLIEHRETYEHLGEVDRLGRRPRRGLADEQDADAGRRRADRRRRGRTTYDPAAAPPAVAWEFLTSPARRPRWQAGVTDDRRAGAPAGRRGVGTTNHCVHGKDAIVEEILDWRPYDYCTHRSQMPIPGAPEVKTTYRRSSRADDDGTARRAADRPAPRRPRTGRSSRRSCPASTDSSSAGSPRSTPLARRGDGAPARDGRRRAGARARRPKSAGRFLDASSVSILSIRPRPFVV